MEGGLLVGLGFKREQWEGGFKLDVLLGFW